MLLQCSRPWPHWIESLELWSSCCRWEDRGLEALVCQSLEHCGRPTTTAPRPLPLLWPCVSITAWFPWGPFPSLLLLVSLCRAQPWLVEGALWSCASSVQPSHLTTATLGNFCFFIFSCPLTVPVAASSSFRLQVFLSFLRRPVALPRPETVLPENSLRLNSLPHCLGRLPAAETKWNSDLPGGTPAYGSDRELEQTVESDLRLQ